MRETNGRGNVLIYMPRNRQDAAHKLGELSALAAAREWERAAIIALLVRPGKPGRKCSNVRPKDTQGTYNINEFVRLGIYGFRSCDSVRAYLRAWGLSGLATPEWGQKIELPHNEFPDVETLYGRVGADESTQELDPWEDEEAPEGTEDRPEVEDAPSPPHPGPIPRPRPEQTSMLDKFLQALDRTDPAAVVQGHDPGQISLLIKTLDSWLESLREAAGEMQE